MRMVLMLALLVSVSCATSAPSAQSESVVPSPVEVATSDQPEAVGQVSLKESFFFVHCIDEKAWVLLDGDGHLALESAALDGADRPLTMMSGTGEGFVIAEPLSDPGIAQVKNHLGVRRFRLFNRGDPVAVGTLGTPMLVGRVVPHFGTVQEWSESGLEPDDEGGEAARRDLRNTAAMHLMAPLDISCKDDVFYWARPESLPIPEVATFHEVGAGTEMTWSKRTTQLDEWAELEARVYQAYKESGENPPPLDVQVFATRKQSDVQPCKGGCYHVQLHLGTTMCGMGPDEALFSVFWSSDGQQRNVVEERHSPFIPVLVGDFDGDGVGEVVGRTDPLSETVELFKVSGGALAPVKSTSVTYADCPC